MADGNKAKRYDRQIRIWGAHGQGKLEAARICLLNGSATGSELLKNLVLGGIHSFTIVDDAKVTAPDLGNNFMVSAESLGHSRAECVTELLKEMNDTVVGTFAEEAPETLLDSQPEFFKDFSMVLATQMREPDLLKLDALCRQNGVALLIVRSYGLMGYLRISVPEHRVEDCKPDNIIWDLRLDCPFMELEEWALSFDFATLDDITHKHVPYVALLIQAAHEWKAAHNGELPSTTAERREFKESISRKQRTIDGIPVDEENFSEALSASFRVWTPLRIDPEVQSILDDPAADITTTSDDFWIMVAAVRAFVGAEGAGRLPLDGVIPDMTATTELYLQLQRIYQKQAAADLQAVTSHVQRILSSVGRQPGSISAEAVKSFCKLSRNMRVLRYHPLADEVGGKTADERKLRALLSAEDKEADISLYILLRAVDRFYAENHRYPGAFDNELDEDIAHLKSLAGLVTSETYPGLTLTVSDDLVAEMVRFGAGELHCVAAVMGGIGAQEAIKLLTRQFATPAGTTIYNAMASTTSVFDI